GADGVCVVTTARGLAACVGAVCAIAAFCGLVGCGGAMTGAGLSGFSGNRWTEIMVCAGKLRPDTRCCHDHAASNRCNSSETVTPMAMWARFSGCVAGLMGQDKVDDAVCME